MSHILHDETVSSWAIKGLMMCLIFFPGFSAGATKDACVIDGEACSEEKDICQPDGVSAKSGTCRK